MAKLELKVDSNIESQADAAERLAKALKAVRMELEALGDYKHGGIEYQQAGHVSHLTVTPKH